MENLTQNEIDQLIKEVSQDVTFQDEESQFETELFDLEMYLDDTEEVA
jgi:hypothetical protein